MKIVYMGTPDFAVLPLESILSAGYDVAAVFTQPDKPAGRGMKLTSPPVKKAAQRHGIPVFQPEKIRPALPDLRKIGSDLIISAAYGKLLPEEILNLPPLGCVNIHASLLPRLRGAAPIQRAIAEGESLSGVTTMYMAKELDAGDMIFSEETEITPSDTGETLHDRLMEIGARLIIKTLKALESGTAPRIPQNHAFATYAPSLKKEDARIDWSRKAAEIFNHIRGFCPFPGAFTGTPSGEMKLYGSEVLDLSHEAVPGTVLAPQKGGIPVACGNGALLITELKAPGGKRMAAADYLRGHEIKEGTRLG